MPHNTRHAYSPDMETADLVWEGLSILALLLLLVLPAAYFTDLPDSIPQHYNARGEADGFGSKRIIWALPVIGAFLFGLLTLLSRMPHIYNYPLQITEENAPYQYKLAARMIRMLKALILLMFAFLTWKMIDGALSGNMHLGSHFLWIFLASLAGLLGWYFWSVLS